MSAKRIPGNAESITVGLAEGLVFNNPEITLKTGYLGSCLAISIYDPTAKTGGIMHTMLPSSKIVPHRPSSNPAMFVDTGLPAFFDAATRLNADKNRFQICIAGGAQFLGNLRAYDVGKTTYEALMRMLDHEGLKPKAQQIGGQANLGMSLRLGTGEVRLHTSGQESDGILWSNLTIS